MEPILETMILLSVLYVLRDVLLDTIFEIQKGIALNRKNKFYKKLGARQHLFYTEFLLIDSDNLIAEMGAEEDPDAKGRYEARLVELGYEFQSVEKEELIEAIKSIKDTKPQFPRFQKLEKLIDELILDWEEVNAKSPVFIMDSEDEELIKNFKLIKSTIQEENESTKNDLLKILENELCSRY